MINREVLTMTLAGLVMEEVDQWRQAVASVMESKMPLIKHIINLRLECCAPCHKWRMGK